MSQNDHLAQHASRQTSALETMAKRLAPDQLHQWVDFYGEDETAAPKVMQLPGPFNKIEHALTSGKVGVWFGPPHGNADFIIDATIPGPVYFPAKHHPAIAFAVLTGSAAVNGRIHVENY
jgi:hypothetical protein